jgi:hypothetical protein
VIESVYSDEIRHHGIKGQKWGVRRTPEQLGHPRSNKRRKKNRKKINKQVLAGAGIAVASAGLGYLMFKGASRSKTIHIARQILQNGKTVVDQNRGVRAKQIAAISVAGVGAARGIRIARQTLRSEKQSNDDYRPPKRMSADEMAKTSTSDLNRISERIEAERRYSRNTATNEKHDKIDVGLTYTQALLGAVGASATLYSTIRSAASARKG